jgi:hypothetical protein
MELKLRLPITAAKAPRRLKLLNNGGQVKACCL